MKRSEKGRDTCEMWLMRETESCGRCFRSAVLLCHHHTLHHCPYTLLCLLWSQLLFKRHTVVSCDRRESTGAANCPPVHRPPYRTSSPEPWLRQTWYRPPARA